jgi:hypothetical protein
VKAFNDVADSYRYTVSIGLSIDQDLPINVNQDVKNIVWLDPANSGGFILIYQVFSLYYLELESHQDNLQALGSAQYTPIKIQNNFSISNSALDLDPPSGNVIDI